MTFHAPVIAAERQLVSVAWADGPFAAVDGRVHNLVLPAGLSIAELLARIDRLPAGFAEHGVVCLNGHPVPRKNWRLVRPRVDGPVPVAMTLHIALGPGGARGGRAAGGGAGGASGGRVLAVIASIALIALTGWIGAGGLATAFGLQAFAAGTFAARALAAGVGLIGSLAVRALSPPPAEQAQGGAALPTQGVASASGNVLARGGTIPRVVGSYRVHPSFACFPRVRLDNGDTYAEAVYCLAGPHLLEDIKLGASFVEDMEDVEVETRAGWDDDTALTLVTAQSFTDAPNMALSAHRWGPEAGTDDEWPLEDQATPANSLPVWHRVTSRPAPRTVELHFAFPSGLSIYEAAAPGALLPMRIRIRRRGNTTWRNLPEIMWFGATQEPMYRVVELRFYDPPAIFPEIMPPENRDVAMFAWVETAGQSASPSTSAFEAHGNFDDASGGDYFGRSGPLASDSWTFDASTRLRRFYFEEDRVVAWLDTDDYPLTVAGEPAPYEIEIKRGAVFPEEHFDAAGGYEYRGAVRDFFHYRTDGGTHYALRASENQFSDVVLTQVVTVWPDDPPVAAGSGLALIAIRAKNRPISDLSVLASGYVPDWNGVDDWDDWTTTSNPAPHLRDVLAGALNRRALAAAQIDDAAILAWRTHCAAMGYEVNAILDGRSMADALALIASCGYGRPTKSETWGVAWDRDRSADMPVQMFNPRNMAGFSWSKAFADLPDHLVASYRDASQDFEEREIVVYADGVTAGTATLPESVDYVGLVTSAEVTARAEFDLRQARLRSTFYSGRVSVENIVCRRGDLVAVQHDTLALQAGFARIRSVVTDGGDPEMVTGLVLDSTIPAGDGSTYGMAIRQTDGEVLVEAIAYPVEETDTIAFVTPFELPAGGILAAGCLVSTGPLATEYRRMIVADIAPGEDMTAQLAFMDEAPNLWSPGMRAAAAAAIAITAAADATSDAVSGTAAIAITAAAAVKLLISTAAAAAAMALTATADGRVTRPAAGAASIAVTTTGGATVTAPLGVTYTDDDASSSISSSFTFNGLDAGAADSTRIVYVAVALGGYGSGSGLVSATINGAAATRIGPAGNLSGAVAWFHAAVPTGTAVDVVVTPSVARAGCAVGVFRVVNAVGSVPHDSDVSVASSVGIDILAGGAALAVSLGTGGAASWTGVSGAGSRINFSGSLDASFGLSTGLSAETNRTVGDSGATYFGALSIR